MIYPLWVQFDVLHGFRLSKQHHLLDDVHLVVGVDGLVELPVVCEGEMTEDARKAPNANARSAPAVKWHATCPDEQHVVRPLHALDLMHGDLRVAHAALQQQGGAADHAVHQEVVLDEVEHFIRHVQR